MIRFRSAVNRVLFISLAASCLLGSVAAQAQNLLAAAMDDPQSPGHIYQQGGNPPDLGMNTYSGSGGVYASGCQNCNAGGCGCSNGCGCDGCGCCGSNCCGSNCCGSNCGCWPKWYVDAGAVFLWRNNGSINQPVVITSGSQAPTTLIDTHSTDFDTGIGPQVMLGVRTSPCSAWCLQYFSAFDFQGDSSVSSEGSLAAAGILGEQGIDWSSADQMSTHYTSDLHNVELNHVHTWGCWSLLSGFRFVDLTEDYDITTVSGTSTSAYDVHTRNNLYGGQLGARYRHCCHRFFWDCTGKAGVFGNAAQQTQLLTDDNSSVVYRDSIDHEGTVAFVGDVNVSVGFQLSCVWAVRCGYNVMWIDQVALAPDQLNFDPSSPGTTTNTGGDVFLQGINVALEARW